MTYLSPTQWRVSACALAIALALPTHAAEQGDEAKSQLEPLDCVINPSVVADLGSGVPGILSEVSVDRSDFVTAGQVVAQLESGVELAARDLAQVRASKDAEVQLRRVNAAFGQRQYARSEDLFQRKVISTNDMDERKTEARLSRIQLRQALDNQELAQLELGRAEQVLKRRTIKSPITGVVMERFKTIGEYVDDNPIVRVAQLDPLHVEVFVPVEKLGEIRPGMRAEVWSEAISGDGWQARVTRVDRVADVASGTYGVRLVLPNPDYTVPAGLRCRLAFASLPNEPQAAEAPPIGAPFTSADNIPAAHLVAETTPVVQTSGADTPAGVQHTDQQTAESPATDRVRNESDSAAPLLFGGGATSTLIHDPGVETAADTAADASPIAVVPDQPVVSDLPAPVCLTAGPYDTQQTAEEHARQLRAGGLDVQIDAYQSQETRGYRVVSSWFYHREKAEEFVALLKAAKVKDYLLPTQGESRVRVSLGLYPAESFAERRVDELSQKDIPARVVPWTRATTHYALKITGRPDALALPMLEDLPGLSGEAPAMAASCEKLANR